MKIAIAKSALRSATCVAALSMVSATAFAQDAAPEEQAQPAAAEDEGIVVIGTRIGGVTP